MNDGDEDEDEEKEDDFMADALRNSPPAIPPA
jgi:hypothetical protein